MERLTNFFRKYWWLGVLAILATHIIVTFYGLWRYHYPVASGGDMFVHLRVVRNILLDPSRTFHYGYPPLYHLIVVGVTRLTHGSYLQVSAFITPSLVVISGLAVWVMADRLFGRSVGLLTYLFYALVSLQPLQTASDGGLPTILGGHIIFPLLVLAFISLWKLHGWRWWLTLALSVALAGALLIAHHLSTLIAAAVLLSSLLPLSIWRIRKSVENKWFGTVLGLIIWLLVLIAALIFFFNSPLLAKARVLAALFIHFSNHFPFITLLNNVDSNPWPFIDYSLSINGLLFQLSAFASIWLLIQIWRRKASFSLLLFVIWWWILFVGSRMNWVGEPGRLARDLALPASVLAAYGLTELLSRFRSFTALKTVTLLAVVPLIIAGAYLKTTLETKFSHTVYLSTADSTLREYVRSSTQPVYVWDGSALLQYYLQPEQTAGRVIFIYSEEVASGYLANSTKGSCLVAGYFQPGVWPEYFADAKPLSRLATQPGISSRLLATDSEKVWYLLCK